MSTLRDSLASCYPSVEQLPFCAALRRGLFDKDEVLCAEVVEIYRALLVRDRIKRACESKLTLAVESGVLSMSGAATIRTVVDDEGETEDHLDHLDMRFKLFRSLGVARDVRLLPHRQLDEINAAYVTLIEASDVFEVIGINAAMEDWYAPVSGFFEAQYLSRGFTLEEVETYTVHKAADVWHSNAGYQVLTEHQGAFDIASVADAVRRVFATSLAYDTMKLELAQGGDIHRLLVLPQ
jgi:hypothetical protein